MSDDRPISVKDFAAAFKLFLEQVADHSPAHEPVLRQRLIGHFRADVAQFSIISDQFDMCERPNLQLALDSLLAAEGRSVELLGINAGGSYSYYGIGLAQLLMPAQPDGARVTQGPVEYSNVDLEGGRVLPCVESGLYLITDADLKLAVVMRGPGDRPYSRSLHVEVMAPERARSEAFLAELRRAMRGKNVYRGRVLSLEEDRHEELRVEFHSLPRIRRDQIILPSDLLDRIERQTVRFGELSDKLLAGGRHLKRGILLHGPPGTGKTLTAMYLASLMKNRTVILLTGRGLGLIEQSCAMARALQPAMVVLEDVDLVAEERTRQGQACNALLFELLNQMDGLADDADIIFLLTTNRPDILEPALASRPGRVDQAIEVPLPDADCRRGLFDLYGAGLKLDPEKLRKTIDRTEGASAAFIRELMRKAALFAADEGSAEIQDSHVDEALDELVISGGPLTQTLLGMQPRRGV
jgi:hypothetical protein